MSTTQARLREFTAGGASLQGVPSKLMLSAALAVVAATTVLAPLDAHGQDYYRAIDTVVDVQLQIDEELGEGVALIGHSGVDMDKAFAKLGNTDMRILFRGLDEAPIENHFKGPAGVYDLGGAEQEHFDRFNLYMQVASAFVNASPNEHERTAFATLATLRDGAPMEFVQIMAAKAELNDLTGVQDFISYPAMERILGSTVRIGTDVNLERFSLKDLGSVGAQYANSAMATTVTASFGEAMGGVLENTNYYIPVKDGVVVGNQQAWLESASGIPEVARVVELQSYLYDRNSKDLVLGEFVPDRETSIREVAKLALAGDTQARDIAKAFDLDQDFRYSPIHQVQDLPSSHDVQGTPIQFDREDLYVYSGAGGQAFFAVTRAHDLVFIATPEGMKSTFYEQSGHDATYRNGLDIDFGDEPSTGLRL